MSRPRIAIGGFQHESNTFNPHPTGLSDFAIDRGDELVRRWEKGHHELSAFIQGAAQFDYEAIPTLMGFAWPAGTVTAEAFDTIVNELIDLLRQAGPLDGILLSLHGAMVSEPDPDGDGAVLERLRSALGPDLPIVVTHDYHANVSQALIDRCTALVVETTNPHLDQIERGLLAARILTDTVNGKVRPVQALAKPPMLLNIVHQYTDAEPNATFRRKIRELEARPQILAVSVVGGYQYADVEEMGPSVVVVTDDDPDLARREAQGLSDMMVELAGKLTFDLPDAAQAVRQAIASPDAPVVLVEMGDNVGGGSAADSTIILSELLEQGADGWVVVLHDPQAVQACAEAGIGATLTLQVGGKEDDLHGAPVEVTGRVTCLHDGRFREWEVRHGGRFHFDQGLTALLEITGPSGDALPSYLLLNSERVAPVSLQQIRSVGIQPERQRILVAKACQAYRAAYEPIAGRIIGVDTPGLTAVNPARFTFQHARYH